ncbi:SPOR domain-containing protein [Psychroflexus tropicus]|uniref:HU domain-containing protein n=1 Tax=Psychroflexus tropicus TaxID=197345 RepID=UPI00037C8E28|nr:SPOR domain-containing protein [Psychroflexus tropicus]
MRVEEYIKQLLYRYECVIVPGFGAFITQFTSSQYLEKSHQFIPPTRSLTFNKSIQSHDGLLAETIAKGESMDFESAKHKIALFVKDFNSALEVERQLEISQLGCFYLDKEDKLSFEPETSINYFVDAFGLDQIMLNQVATGNSDLVIENSKDKEEIENKKVIHLPHSNAEESAGKKSYFKYAAVGILALSIASFAGIYQYNNYLISYNDSEAQKAESLIQERIQNAEFNYTLSEIPLTSTNIEAIRPKYHIVAGAFRVKANAEKKINLLKAKGYNARMIDQNAYGLYQVAFSSFQNRTEALLQLRKIKTLENPEAWLYVKQL